MFQIVSGATHAQPLALSVLTFGRVA